MYTNYPEYQSAANMEINQSVTKIEDNMLPFTPYVAFEIVHLYKIMIFMKCSMTATNILH